MCDKLGVSRERLGIWEKSPSSEKLYLNSSLLQSVLFFLLRLKTRAHELRIQIPEGGSQKVAGVWVDTKGGRSQLFLLTSRELNSVCVRACVCERGREREEERFLHDSGIRVESRSSSEGRASSLPLTSSEG